MNKPARWSPALIDALEKHLLDAGLDGATMREVAVAAMDHIADYDNPVFTIPFRMGFLMGALSRSERIRAVYPTATKAEINAAHDALWAIAKRGYEPP